MGRSGLVTTGGSPAISIPPPIGMELETTGRELETTGRELETTGRELETTGRELKPRRTADDSGCEGLEGGDMAGDTSETGESGGGGDIESECTDGKSSSNSG